MYIHTHLCVMCIIKRPGAGGAAKASDMAACKAPAGSRASCVYLTYFSQRQRILPQPPTTAVILLKLPEFSTESRGEP